MRELFIPIGDFSEDESIEICLSSNENKKYKKYKLETIYFQETNIQNNFFARVEVLKEKLKEYDKDWELMQIFTISNTRNKIRALFKKIEND